MLLSRFVRIQLIIFTIASLIGLSLMLVRYLQLPTLMGIGHIKVTLELPAAGGLYRFSNVTYRGVQVGKVTDITVVDGKRVNATLSLDSSTIPADASAHVRSMSAAGEQYVDLQPRNESGPYLRDGSVITLSHTTIPQRAGPMLDQLSALVDSIPKDRLGNLLDETFKGFDGAGYDFGSLLDSSATLTADFNRNADHARKLVDDSVPLLQSQSDSIGAVKVWAHGLAGVTGQLSRNDPELRTILQTGPGFAQQVSGLLDQIKPTLPVLLANLTTIGQIGVTYHASLEQILVLLPPNIAVDQSVAPTGNPTGAATGDFSLTLGDPPACTVGFLPPSQWRSPADTSEIDTPDGLYCKLPQDSPIAVRGARNYPCMGHPGKRAPTVQICDSDKPFMPLALRQHVTGPYPLDPNLIAQGIPPDDRVNTTENLYGPVAGTPLPPPISPPPGGGPGGPPRSANLPGPVAGLAPWDSPDSPAPAASAPAAPAPAAPSAWHADGSGPGPSVAVVHYNPKTGAYMAPDGHVYHQADLRASAKPKLWTDLVLGAQ
jgi:phospholipid/cholesterol/gamma-HCH transport system substrate-binding protein